MRSIATRADARILWTGAFRRPESATTIEPD